MTKKFDEFIKTIIKESFADLPDDCPYGFWISPSGDVRPVPFEAHGVVARRIIDSIPRYKEEFEKHISGFTDNTAMLMLAMGMLKKRGYIRVVKDENTYMPTLYYTSKDIPNHKQSQTLQDLSILYDMRIERDK